jgi:thiosulfate reductase cytochrome b subunit
MKNATKRSILRWIHLIVTVPILGFVYGKPSDVQQYAGGVQLVFVPLVILTGYWMYSGFMFAAIGVAAWLGANRVSGYVTAVVIQLVLLVGRKVWLVNRGGKSTRLVSEH